MGAQYSKTRHNVGSICLDYLVRRRGLRYQEKANCPSQVAMYSKMDHNSQYSAVLLNPYSYMNVIGKNVKTARKVYRVEQEGIVVLHDDLEQKLGKFRIVKGTSFKGHNGLKSISQELGGYKNFLRIGIGISRPE